MKKIVLFAALIGVLSFTSCSDDDGDWSPMKWKTSVRTEKDGTINVPSEGGSYVFVCTNYKRPWMSDLKEIIDGKETYYSRPCDDNPNSAYSIASPWLTAQWKDNILTVTVKPNETGKEREMEVGVTAGDIFHTFTFKQVVGK